MNKVILMGRLTRDPEIRTTQTGRMVARLGLAVDRPGARRQDAQPGQQTVDFINLVMWEKSADLAQRYLVKGSQILVEGRLSVRSYDDQQGQKRTVTEVVVERFEFAGSRPQGGGQQSGYGAPAPAQSGYSQPAAGYNQPAAPAFGSDDDEDVPF